MIYNKLQTGSDHKAILEQIIDADVVIFSITLYVDSLPSHVLTFLLEMEGFCKEHKLNSKIYVIANNGFIEGSQNAPLFRVMENFCIRSNLRWGGGIGIGGGVMFHALGIVLMVEIGIFFAHILISGILHANWASADAVQNFLFAVLAISFLPLGAAFYIAKMGLKINADDDFGEKYTRILLPSFVFIPIADIFFVISSLLKGGLFKGWLRRK